MAAAASPGSVRAADAAVPSAVVESRGLRSPADAAAAEEHRDLRDPAAATAAGSRALQWLVAVMVAASPGSVRAADAAARSAAVGSRGLRSRSDEARAGEDRAPGDPAAPT